MLVAENRWQAIIDYYKMLPGYSLTEEAILNDPDAVESMAKAGLFNKKPGDKKIRVSENTPLLEAIQDLVVEMRISNSIATGNKYKVTPTPGLDVPLVEEAQAKAKQDEYDELKAFFGGQ